jgi:hypothetical protein
MTRILPVHLIGFEILRKHLLVNAWKRTYALLIGDDEISVDVKIGLYGYRKHL